MCAGVEREFGYFADEPVVVQMHADRERVIADLLECLARLGGILEEQVMRLFGNQPGGFVQTVAVQPGDEDVKAAVRASVRGYSICSTATSCLFSAASNATTMF